MLILTRKIGEAICIGGEDIRVTVLNVDNRGGVHLGIDAPKHVPVHRDEIQRRLETPVSFAKPTEKS